MTEPDLTLTLNGVHHTARPTWKLRETVEFYRDIMGLPLIHCIAARGWGPNDHPDFLHFFFDSGNGSTIAFFYYIGTDRPTELVQKEHHFDRATHTAWQVPDLETLARWRARLEGKGLEIRYQLRHEVIESIYCLDPNGYSVEITAPLRPFVPLDALDAEMSIQAAIEAEDAAAAAGDRLRSITDIWERKGQLVARLLETAA
ncbi:hypothetical protein KOAAANKH_00789 [Brevundimonas sp. NIBR10]|uniref:VOC family protein n=1 Tax=Brevundimonas sp. NIBR10 TaxID=3015997 RepID=UPI0022F163E5|nr:VOC family protein [Brevundimonas sp. NIBR10]WGM45924.1 hypothetical protein KOAAANKH_00789 [Brevundimonas sp. NIBR10]